jgi:hypothetical protein
VAAALTVAWRYGVAALLLVAGAVAVSLAPLAAFEGFRAVWEWNDGRARDALLREPAHPAPGTEAV